MATYRGYALTDTSGNVLNGSGSIIGTPVFSGDIWYVDSAQSDSNSGTNKDDAKATIGAAIGVASAGDAINIKAGTYDENGLDVNLDALELWAEIGTLIVNTNPGTCLTVLADTCFISGVVVQQAGQIGYAITGDGCFFQDCTSSNNTIAFDNDGVRCTFVRCKDQNATVTGFDMATEENTLYLCNTIATGGTSRGFYLSNAAADRNMIYQCLSAGNITAGYEVVSGCTGNTIAYSVSGGGDGHKVDAGTNTQWAEFTDHAPRERHEEVYPYSDGEGAAGLPINITTNADDETNAAATSQNYWGEPKLIMPVTTVTQDFALCGYYVFAGTAAKIISTTFYRINYGRSSAKNGGNAWDEGATVLTVADGTNFQTNDLVWIFSDYKTDGEIVRVTGVATHVVTIERESSQFGAANTGLRWNHTTNDAGTEVMYLIYRATSDGMHGIETNYSASSSKDSGRFILHACKELRANDGIVARSVNQTDGFNGTNLDVAVIYED